MVTCAGDREIGVVSGKLLDNPGELACIQFFKFLCYVCKSHHVRWGHDREISDQSVEALMYWPCHSEVNTSRLSLRFPCNDWMDEVNNYLSHGLFFDKCEKLWIWACGQLKPITGQWISLMSCSFEPVCTVMWHWSADTLFAICQLPITWMSTVKLKTDGTLYLPWTSS